MTTKIGAVQDTQPLQISAIICKPGIGVGRGFAPSPMIGLHEHETGIELLSDLMPIDLATPFRHVDAERSREGIRSEQERGRSANSRQQAPAHAEMLDQGPAIERAWCWHVGAITHARSSRFARARPRRLCRNPCAQFPQYELSSWCCQNCRAAGMSSTISS